MFEALAFHRQLSNLQRERRSTEREYMALIRQARRDKKSSDDIQQIKETMYEDLKFTDEDIEKLESRFLIERAQNLRVPTPPLLVNDKVSADWVQSDMGGAFYLTGAACAKLRSDIRKERKERWEEWTRWTPLLSSLTGLLGVVVAIVALAVRANH